MRWALERMRQELLETQPGGALVARHLAHMMLVQALRLYLADGVGRNVGWLFAGFPFATRAGRSPAGTFCFPTSTTGSAPSTGCGKRTVISPKLSD